MYKLTTFLQELCFITTFLHRYNKNGVTVIKFTLLCLTLLYFYTALILYYAHYPFVMIQQCKLGSYPIFLIININNMVCNYYIA